MKSYTPRFCIFVLSIFILSTFSCSSTKKTKYFQDIPDSGQLKTIAQSEYIEPKIQVDDILTIILQTVDPQASMLINSGNVSGANTPASTAMPLSSFNQNPSGYLVDKNGAVTIPILGKIKLAGLSTRLAGHVIDSVADNYYKDHSVIVRFANFRINVGGEVLRPGTYTMPNEKVTVVDAITMAGDLTIYGKRDNVLLVRENADGTKTPYRINLKKTDFMSSPYYYLRQNDYIYVEPSKAKAAAQDATQVRNYTIAGSILSIIAIILTRR